MSQPTISTELVRNLRHRTLATVTDYRDPKLPGFVLRAPIRHSLLARSAAESTMADG